MRGGSGEKNDFSLTKWCNGLTPDTKARIVVGEDAWILIGPCCQLLEETLGPC